MRRYIWSSRWLPVGISHGFIIIIIIIIILVPVILGNYRDRRPPSPSVVIWRGEGFDSWRKSRSCFALERWGALGGDEWITERGLEAGFFSLTGWEKKRK